MIGNIKTKELIKILQERDGDFEITATILCGKKMPDMWYEERPIKSVKWVMTGNEYLLDIDL